MVIPHMVTRDTLTTAVDILENRTFKFCISYPNFTKTSPVYMLVAMHP